MGPIEITCPTFGRLGLIGDRLHDGHDFVVRSNSKNNVVDYFIFLDSRGISHEFDNSLADKLISRITDLNKTYLLVCRPLELTIWVTLISLLTHTRLNPSKIITNMGFVDFTPKKLSILQSALVQIESVLGKGVAESYFVEDFVSSRGGTSLFSMRFKETYRDAIEAIAARHQIVIINTPLTDPGIKIQRMRPRSFFSAQIESNMFNRSISSAHVIELPDFDEALTYDAVHYTCSGNDLIFDKVKEYL